MTLSCGIIGLPNAGKSTLFNAFGGSAKVANFSFCTIEPNLQRVAVPDPRLAKCAEISKSEEVVPTWLEIVDIAGLVRGAHNGEGLGNRFLAQIREADLLLHVTRCFTGEANHPEGTIDPLRDITLIETELALADLESLDRQEQAATKRARGGDEEATARLAAIALARPLLEAGKPARHAEVSAELEPIWRTLNLLTAQKVIFVANVGEDSQLNAEATADHPADNQADNQFAQAVRQHAESEQAGFFAISASVEAEIAALDTAEDRAAFLSELGLQESGLDRLIRSSYEQLGLLTFLTSGAKETRAWTIPTGATAAQAAGSIHSDMERGFIRAEVVSYEDFVELGGEAGARNAGRLRSEGKDYTVKDGDILHIRFNV